MTPSSIPLRSAVVPPAAPPSARLSRRWAGAAHPGQVLVMTALFLTAMLGMLGLAVDLGFAFAERRAMQNAADAGALAGARLVAVSDPRRPLSAQAEVEAVARQNAMTADTVGTIACTYVDDAGDTLGGCGGTVSRGSTGVRVEVEEVHPTFFIRVVPGAPAEVTISAGATAHVKRLAAPKDGPFLPCGIDTVLAGGGRLNLLTGGDGGWAINPAAIGETFKIHGPQIETCEAVGSRFKGIADVNRNRNRIAPEWFGYKEGDAAGHIENDVEGPNGCKARQVVDNCVVFLPIAVPTPPEVGNDREVWVVFFAPFYVTSPKPNEHHGKLLDDYIVYGRGQGGEWGWYADYGGPITVRLTG